MEQLLCAPLFSHSLYYNYSIIGINVDIRDTDRLDDFIPHIYRSTVLYTCTVRRTMIMN